MSDRPLKDRGVTQGDSRSDKKCRVPGLARVAWDHGARLKLAVPGVRPLVTDGREAWALETRGQVSGAVGVWSRGTPLFSQCEPLGNACHPDKHQLQ